MESNIQLLLALTRLGIGHPSGEIPAFKDFQALYDIARKQELQAVVLDAIEDLRVQEPRREDLPTRAMMLPWIGGVLRGFEKRYPLYEYVLAGMADFYSKHGFKMMTFKGYVCCQDWPRPNHRPCGDIDIWLFGKQEEADAVLREKGVPISTGHHHHTIFRVGGLVFENHYDFINVNHHRSGQKMEALLKELAADDSHYMMVRDKKVYIPSPRLNTLFLLYHTMLHFVSTEMNLRQLLDWGFYVKMHREEIEWDWLLPILKEYHLTEFFHCMNAILVEDLGFEPALFPSAEASDLAFKERIREGILAQNVIKKEPAHFLPRVLFRFRRWKDNNWKRRLCFPDSVWSIFWIGVKGHLLKPESI